MLLLIPRLLIVDRSWESLEPDEHESIGWISSLRKAIDEAEELRADS
jgi:hypothetical protein